MGITDTSSHKRPPAQETEANEMTYNLFDAKINF